MSVLNVPYSRQEEFSKERQTHLGASDAGAVVAYMAGMPDYQPPFKEASALYVYLSKIGEYETEPTTAMLAGHHNEPFIAWRWASESGRQVRRDNYAKGGKFSLRRHPEYPHIGVHLDYVVTEAISLPGQPKAWIEAKYPEFHGPGYGEEGTGVIPMWYYAQVQTQFSVLNAQHRVARGSSPPWDVCYFVVLDRTKLKLRTYVVQEDKRFINEALIPSLDGFWKKHVLARVPPDPQPSEAMIAFPKELVGKTLKVDDDPALTAQLRELAQAHADAAAAEKRKTDVCDALRLRMKEAGALIVDGAELVTWHDSKRRTIIDADRLREDHKYIYDKVVYHKDGPRIFTPKYGKIAELMEDKTDE
jgi:predicted phage-related endonuclease